MSSVRYGIRLGDLQNKQPTHTLIVRTVCLFVLCNRLWFNKATGPQPLEDGRWGRVVGREGSRRYGEAMFWL